MLPFDESVAALRLFAHVPGYLRHPVEPDQARAMLQGWRERRSSDFVRLVRECIYPQPRHPYRRLLALAGCEPGDLERLVEREGLEGALQLLFQQGAYLTVDEFKGRRPAVRGSASIEVSPGLLRPPGLAGAAGNQSSGSRGSRTLAPFGIAHMRNRAAAYCGEFEARGGLSWVKAIWDVPGGAIANVLRFSGFGAPIARWFSLVEASAPGLDVRYRLAELALHWGSLLARIRLPRPYRVPMDEPLPIARWMAEVLQAGGVPHLFGYLSPAVQLCQAAQRAGIDLSGAQLTVTGEPLTLARAEVMRRAGVNAMSRYGTAEAGSLAAGCAAPTWSDEHHVLEYGVAVIGAGPAGPARGLPADALLVSSLRAAAPYTLVNLSLGDRATLVRRDCGCPLEQLGWTRHLHSIRSFEKLTAAGMTFLDVDVVRVLEQVLPARFGGGPMHYQLVEGEGLDGRAAVRLVIDPAVGMLDAEAVGTAFLAVLGTGSGAERVMSEVWRTPGLLQVERRKPYRTASGKILHIHRETNPVASTADTASR
jgi:hypothetical protein